MNLSFWADFCGIAGLLVGIGGLILTFFTWRRVGLIKLQIEKYRARHLLAARAVSYVKQLQKIHKSIAALLERDTSISDFLPLLAECRQICISINEKIEVSTVGNSSVHDWQLSSMKELVSYVDETQKEVSGRDKIDPKYLSRFLFHIVSLANEIDQIEKDRKENI